MSDAAAPNPEASTESSLSKRTVANRRNAQKSTGPKTPEGKRKSSFNALTHGLVNNLNIQWAGLIFRPLKTDAPLVIDPNGMLPLAFSLQSFHTVGVERGKVAQLRSRIENAYTLLSLAPDRFQISSVIAFWFVTQLGGGVSDGAAFERPKTIQGVPRISAVSQCSSG